MQGPGQPLKSANLFKSLNEADIRWNVDECEVGGVNQSVDTVRSLVSQNGATSHFETFLLGTQRFVSNEGFSAACMQLRRHAILGSTVARLRRVRAVVAPTEVDFVHAGSREALI